MRSGEARAPQFGTSLGEHMGQAAGWPRHTPRLTQAHGSNFKGFDPILNEPNSLVRSINYSPCTLSSIPYMSQMVWLNQLIKV